jgi:hypothetical protein
MARKKKRLLTGGEGDLKHRTYAKPDAIDKELFAILDKYCQRDEQIILKRRAGGFGDRAVLKWVRKPKE